MAALEYILIIVSSVLIFFLLLPTLNILLSFFRKEKLKEVKEPKQFDFGCIITAYRNVDIAEGLVKSLLNQKHSKHIIYLVADACDISNWKLRDQRLVLLRPAEALNLKAKSIIHAIENFEREHDYIVVFDADNLAHPYFLKKINYYANNGFQSIQGQRTAKNLDTSYACMDAMGEFYKNYIDRYTPYLNGSSAVISGSGMAVESKLYQAYLDSPEIEQGKHLWKKMLQEDKILQNFLLRQNEKIAYAWDAIVYDEKVTTGQAVETQRSRWLFSYFQNIPNSLGIMRRGILNFSWNQLLFSLVTISPPLIIMLGGSLLMSIIWIFINPLFSIFFLGSLLVWGLTIFWTLYLSKAPKEIMQTIWAIPLFVWKQVLGLFKMNNPNKNFKHTEHNRDYSIEDVLKERS